MKSAYEIAMARLNEASGPAKKLDDGQRTRIAELEKKHDARDAQVKLSFEERFNGAESPAELAALKAEMAAELQAIEDKRAAEKDAVWNEA